MIYIDSKNMTQLYGLKLLKGSYKSLVTMPTQRGVYSQSWKEYNGVEVDLTNTSLEPIKFDINVYSKDMDSIIYTLKDGVSHTLYIEELGKQFAIRYSSSNNKVDYLKGSSISLELFEDIPARPTAFNEPSCSVYIKDVNKIDDIYLSRLGIVIGRNGLYDLRNDEVRDDLLVKYKYKDGQTYDPNGYMSSKEKTITIPMTMRAKSISEFWNNYDSLLYILTDKSLHKLDGKNFYYKQCKSRVFFIDKGEIWWEFDLELVFTNND